MQGEVEVDVYVGQEPDNAEQGVELEVMIGEDEPGAFERAT